LDTWVILAAGGTLLILVIAVTLLVRGSRDRDMERLKEELIDIERKRDRARRRKSSGKEAAVEVEAVKEPSKTVIRKKAGARGTDKVEEAKVPNGDDEEGGDGRAAKATEEETLEELFIACPACQNEFTSQVGGGWPHVIECPECGARGRVTEEMAAAMAG